MKNALSTAIRIAAKAHSGQKDRGGRPYILHPLAVMARMDTDEERIVAVLHDVVEDTSVNLASLKNCGFSPAVLEAISLLSKPYEDFPYEEFIARIKSNKLAVKVKLADIAENMKVSRLPSPLTERDIKRLQKYQKAIDFLTG